MPAGCGTGRDECSAGGDDAESRVPGEREVRFPSRGPVAGGAGSALYPCSRSEVPAEVLSAQAEVNRRDDGGENAGATLLRTGSRG
jgi:hypothetical protein